MLVDVVALAAWRAWDSPANFMWRYVFLAFTFIGLLPMLLVFGLVLHRDSAWVAAGPAAGWLALVVMIRRGRRLAATEG